MERAYKPTSEQEDILEISSVLENAPYLLNEGEKLTYVETQYFVGYRNCLKIAEK